ncbi:MAG: UDP-N-acetylglucosamine--N-acetylmuramyl-(pentapeptide) pyrophosphoryl-undecaprenol N-acetylglucosamine transferase [Anaerolineaceae bacterium]|nr:UDP-N-acetylglucosamine--N-acetylmuramyl-(pentapeptide) pyrophosphoryl-undecaprenol N-acetylglucosamine transferase [Anaerolineaceae bacterium]
MRNENGFRIMVAAGGTGGHVYPALAIAEALVRLYPQVSLGFVGGVGGFERPLMKETTVQFATYDEVRSGPLHGVNILKMLVSAIQLIIGTVQALWLVKRRNPDALLLTGGWVGLPVALAAWVWRVPSMIFLPDIEPGLTIQVLRRLVRKVALTVDESKQYFPSNETVTTGYPLRQSMLDATREAGIKQFGLDESRKTLLVFGGSRGSRAINYALLDILPQLLADGVQVIHVTGTLDWPDIEARRKAMPDTTHYRAFPYLHHEMGLAMAAADVVVCRSGASTLGEFPQFGLPSILIPLAWAWRYQKVNADYLAERGAAIELDEKDMTERLLPTLHDLLHDAARLEQMQQAARRLARPDGAKCAAEALVELAGANR